MGKMGLVRGKGWDGSDEFGCKGGGGEEEEEEG